MDLKQHDDDGSESFAEKMNVPSLKIPYNMICWPETHH